MSIKTDFQKELTPYLNRVKPTTHGFTPAVLGGLNMTDSIHITLPVIDKTQKINLTGRLPFEDFFFSLPIYLHPGEKNWYRVKRMGVKIRIYRYQKMLKNNDIALNFIFDVGLENDDIVVIFPDKEALSFSNYKKLNDFAPVKIKEETANVLHSVSSVLHLLEEHQLEVSFSPSKKNYRFQKMPKPMREKYVEYSFVPKKVIREESNFIEEIGRAHV